MVSPVVGLYAIMGVQTAVTGGGWFPALALCLVMQLLVATVYAELASQFPIAGGAYKWAHQLGGPATGQFAGVIYVSSTIAMLTTTAYTGGIWLAIFFGSSSENGLTLVLWGAVFLMLCMGLNVARVQIFKMTLSMGVYAEIVGSFGVALLLFLFFENMNCPNCSGIWEPAPPQDRYPPSSPPWPLRAGLSSGSMPVPPSRKKRSSQRVRSQGLFSFRSAWSGVSSCSTPSPSP